MPTRQKRARTRGRNIAAIRIRKKGTPKARRLLSSDLTRPTMSGGSHHGSPQNRLSQADFELIARAFPSNAHQLDFASSAATLAPTFRPPIFNVRLRPSTIKRKWKPEDFYSDKSRIVFCSSFRRMMQKAQVFSLESNTSVRNRLTHSLEVADVGRTLARLMGKQMEARGASTPEDTECMQSIAENACLLHDIGNPPFGHFGEQAIRSWFEKRGALIFARFRERQLPLGLPDDSRQRLNDFLMFDGNPQGFRIVTRLHCDVDHFGLNLTASTLLASIKYPKYGSHFGNKLGVFSSEKRIYNDICALSGVTPGNRYFLAYMMELADDICYCLSDIADGFEKRIMASRDFKEEFRKICNAEGVDVASLIPKGMDRIENFAYDVAVGITRRIMDEAALHFAQHLDNYISGSAKELSEDLPSGKILKCFKAFARRFIWFKAEFRGGGVNGSGG
jgi:dGTPase